VSIKTINAIKASHWEEELKEVKRKIRYYSAAKSKPLNRSQHQIAENMLKTLVKKESELENLIIEQMFLK
jgi:hypothetical protein